MSLLASGEPVPSTRWLLPGLVKALSTQNELKPQLHLPVTALPVHPKDDGWTLYAGLGVEWCYPAPSGLIWASSK